MAVTIKEVARVAGTSASAASFVLNGKAEKRVKPEKIQAVLQAAEKLGYRKNLAASGLALNRTFRLGVCFQGGLSDIPVEEHVSGYDLMRYTIDAAHSKGNAVDFIEVDKGASQLETVKRLSQANVDGLLLHSWPYGEHGNATPNSHPRFLAALADRLPELDVLMGHMGGPEWQAAIEIARPYPNLYLDTGSSYVHFDKIKSAVDVLGAERVLFGSGMTEGSFDMQLGVVLDSEISNEEKNIVLYEAARRLFNI